MLTLDARAIAKAYGGDVSGNTANVPTPGHSARDRGTSITVSSDAPDGIVIHSFNGGDALAIKDMLRRDGFLPEWQPTKTPIDFGPQSPSIAASFEPTSLFEYVTIDGIVRYRKVRTDRADGSKTFAFQHQNNGVWVAGRNGATLLYRLLDIVAAPDATIYMVEGERKADKLAHWGFVATSSKDLPDDLTSYVKGRTVAILPDNDATGATVADKAMKALIGAGANPFIVYLPGLPPKGDIIDWTGTALELVALTEQAHQRISQTPSSCLPLIDVNALKAQLAATPFVWPDPANIPRRAWLFGYWLLRGEITAVIAPGGVGKSMFTAAVSLSLTSGQEFLDKDLPEGPCTVWLWNLEDDTDELARQVTACGLRHGVGPMDCQSRLYVDSGLSQRLCTATEAQDGVKILEPVYHALKAEIIARKIDVLIIDPFVSSHEVSENDNGRIDKVAKRWKRLASETGAAIMLVHHTKKMGGREVRAEDSRGAVSLINAARSTLVLNPMSRDEAEGFGISDKAEQRRLVRVDDDKPNRAPPESAWWFRKDSVDLGNASGAHHSDNVGAASSWSPPDPFDGLSTSDLYAAQMAVDAGDFADSVQANDWAGYAVAEALALDIETQRPRIKSLLRTWKANGAFKVEKRATSKGREKPFLIVGIWVHPADLPTLKSGVGKGVERGENDPVQTHPTPLSLERGGGGGVARQYDSPTGREMKLAHVKEGRS